MNAYTKVSDKGQVVVPKAIRERKGWHAGTNLEVIDTGDGVLLRPRRVGNGLTMEEARARLSCIYTHRGPPVSLEEMRAAAIEAAAERFGRSA